MFIPRVKNEKLSGKRVLNFPIKVFAADAPSADLIPALCELMPYASFDAVSTKKEAELTLELRPGISTKDEYYEIKSCECGIHISARDRRGLVNAAATLSQMTTKSSGKFYISLGEISDYPDKKFRSFMPDTGRKYIPLDEFRAHILMMARAKMNKLHWHISDAEGYPIRFDAYPDIKSPDPDGRKYTKDEVRSLIDYAALFAIDIIPEIDMPGHSDSLTEALPELKCKTGGKVHAWDMCIGTEAAYDYVKTILSEIAELFPYEYIHVGTDEIAMRDLHYEKRDPIPDWDNCEVCKQKFAELGLETTTEKFYYFLGRVYKIVTSLGKKMMMWNDNIDISKSPELPRDILIEFWRVAGENRGPREGCSMLRFLEEGFEVVNADYPNTYIDIDRYVNWQKLKNWNLEKIPADAGELSYLVLGGETCAWDVQEHYAHSLYTVVPAFADRTYNLAPIDDEESFGTALTRFALGVSTPEGLNIFGKYIKDIVLTSNDCEVFSENCDKADFRALLESLSDLTPNEERLIKAYISYM